jgi:hypothetical protein
MGKSSGWFISSLRTFKIFSLIFWSRSFDKNWGEGVEGGISGVQVRAKHYPVKSVIPVEVLDVMVIGYGVIDTVRAVVSRYFSVTEKVVNGEELKVPEVDAFLSPE